jgi:hypothetical protein
MGRIDPPISRVTYETLADSGNRLWDSRVSTNRYTKTTLLRILDNNGGVEFFNVKTLRISGKMEKCPTVSMSFRYVRVSCPDILVHIDGAMGVIELLTRHGGVEA